MRVVEIGNLKEKEIVWGRTIGKKFFEDGRVRIVFPGQQDQNFKVVEVFDIFF